MSKQPWPEHLNTKAKRRRFAYGIAAIELRSHVDSGGLWQLNGLTDDQVDVLSEDLGDLADAFERRSGSLKGGNDE